MLEAAQRDVHSHVDGLVIFLINLDGSGARLKRAQSQLGSQGLSYQRCSAFDGRKSETAVDEHYDHHRTLRYFGRKMLGGEIGCYLSHLSCARSFLETEAKYAVILEDDVQLENEFGATLRELIRWLDENSSLSFDLVNLGNGKLKISTLLQRFGRFELHNAHYFPMTSTALLWSRPGAESFLRRHDKIFAPIDVYFRLWTGQTGRGLAFCTPLARASGFGSDIETPHGQFSRSRFARGPFYFFKRHRRQFKCRVAAVRWKLKTRLALLFGTSLAK